MYQWEASRGLKAASAIAAGTAAYTVKLGGAIPTVGSIVLSAGNVKNKANAEITTATDSMASICDSDASTCFDAGFWRGFGYSANVAITANRDCMGGVGRDLFRAVGEVDTDPKSPTYSQIKW